MVSRLVCLFALLAVHRIAAADPGFVWDAPPSCPDAAEVRARIERRLPGDVSVLGIEVTITEERDGFVAHVDTRAVTVANGTRTLRSTRCDQLADAVAVIVARLATEARKHRVATAPSATDHEEPMLGFHAGARDRTFTPTVISIRTEAASSVAGKWGGGVRALALSGIGMVPSVGIGAELAVFARRHTLFGELAYARWAEQPSYLAAGAPGRVDVGVQLGAIRGGWASDRMPLRAWLGFETGAMRGTGIALYDPRIGATRWTALAAGFGVGWPMADHARLVGTFEVAAPLERARFALGDGTEVYEPAGASARAALGVEVGWR